VQALTVAASRGLFFTLLPCAAAPAKIAAATEGEPEPLKMSRPDLDKIWELSAVMEKAHAVIDAEWPRDACGVSPMPDAVFLTLLDTQAEACRKLGLPEDLPLLTGDYVADMDIVSDYAPSVS
jgi:hypothetical protein